jgi:hypothetical protein
VKPRKSLTNAANVASTVLVAMNANVASRVSVAHVASVVIGMNVMYTITELRNGKFHCEVRIQDGTERWDHDTRQEAIYSVIQAARVLNGSYIHDEDIAFLKEQAPPLAVHISKEDQKLLEDIKRGDLKLLPFDDYLIRYRITREEAETIIDIREGRVRVVRS